MERIGKKIYDTSRNKIYLTYIERDKIREEIRGEIPAFVNYMRTRTTNRAKVLETTVYAFIYKFLSEHIRWYYRREFMDKKIKQKYPKLIKGLSEADIGSFVSVAVRYVLAECLTHSEIKLFFYKKDVFIMRGGFDKRIFDRFWIGEDYSPLFKHFKWGIYVIREVSKHIKNKRGDVD